MSIIDKPISNESKRIEEDLKKEHQRVLGVSEYQIGDTIDDAEVDHVFAFSLGGDTDILNAQLLHRHCNREKSNSETENWTDGEDDTE